MRHTVKYAGGQNIGGAVLPFSVRLLAFPRLDLLPIFQYLNGIAGLLISEDVRMAANHLCVHVVDDVPDIEAASLAPKFRVKNNLEQKIAEFSYKIFRIARIEGVEHFVRFLNQIALQRIVCLLAIPGTSARRPQPRLERDQALEQLPNSWWLWPGLGVADFFGARFSNYCIGRCFCGCFCAHATRNFRLSAKGKHGCFRVWSGGFSLCGFGSGHGP